MIEEKIGCLICRQCGLIHVVMEIEVRLIGLELRLIRRVLELLGDGHAESHLERVRVTRHLKRRWGYRAGRIGHLPVGKHLQVLRLIVEFDK